MRKVYDPPSVMDSNFFHEKSTSQHFLLFSSRQHQTREYWIPMKTRISGHKLIFSRDGGPAQWPNGSGVWLWIGSFEARFSSRVLSGCLAHSYFGCQWISASNLSTHSKKEKKAIKKIKIFYQKMFYPWTKINFAKIYFKTKKIETLAENLKDFV